MELAVAAQRYLEPGGEGPEPDPLEPDEDDELQAQDMAHIAVMGSLVHGARPPKEQREAAERKGYPDNAYTLGDVALGAPVTTLAYAIPAYLDSQGGAGVSTYLLSVPAAKTLVEGAGRFLYARHTGNPIPGLSWKTAGFFAYDFAKRGLKKVLPEEGADWVERKDMQLQIGLDKLGDDIGNSYVETRDALYEGLTMALSPEYRRLNSHRQVSLELSDITENIRESYEEAKETLRA